MNINVESVKTTQSEIGAWQAREFRSGGESPNWYSDALIIAEETGEVCRCFVKRQQDIRGGSDHWCNELRKELGDVAITVLAFGANWGVDVTANIDQFKEIYSDDFTSADVCLLLVGAVGALTRSLFETTDPSVTAIDLSEILMLTAHVSTLEGMNWDDVLSERWTEVQQRRFAKQASVDGV